MLGRHLPGHGHPKEFESASWAKWAPGLVDILQQGWAEHCRTSQEKRDMVAAQRRAFLKALSAAWQAHVAADHVPYDCEICIQAGPGSVSF